MKCTITLICILCGYSLLAQELDSNYITKTLAVRDTIAIDSVSINSSKFVLKQKDQTIIDTSFYKVNYSKALIILKKPIQTDSVVVDYLRYPEFLTKTYKQLDDKIIVENSDNLSTLYKLSQSTKTKTFIPFDGLTTSGSISRGVTVGNNQNSVLNSELDLQVTGKLSDKVSLRASIQDANIPLQESGYSQRLDEFDQVFIELFSDNWNIRAGDIDLQDTNSYFSQFSKRVQGLSIHANLTHHESKTNLFTSGALVRGQFTTSQFIAQEGNQGPYKLQGNNGELFVLIVSGSETVYVNGIAIERGENKDYIIDYNAGEIIFNSTFPITSEMRITVDYQFSERNYSRFIAFGGAHYESEKLKLGISIYSENDAKNQPLQQNLSTEQAQILAQAGDDRSLMIAPSEVAEAFSENRILYKKETIGGVEAFVFSNNPDDTLFSVRFSLVGANQGNYIVISTNAIATIFEYIPAVSGVPQGNYEPVIQLVAPERLQLAIVNGSYKPNKRTTIGFEMAGSRNDLNLFSDLDDDDNDGFAGKLTVNQSIIESDSLWILTANADLDYVQKYFRNIEGLYSPEFSRDWNLEAPTASNAVSTLMDNQALISTKLHLFHPKKGQANYRFEHLNYANLFNGNRHILDAHLRFNRFNIYSNSSILNSDSNLNTSSFFRSYNTLLYSMNRVWLGTKLEYENNEQNEKTTNTLTALSQRFTSYEAFVGIGDSTKVYTEFGYKNRINDSLRSNMLQKVNTSNTYYLKSQLVNNTASKLSLFVNYRTLNNEDNTIEDEESLNSRLQFSQQLVNNLIQWNTVFETNSGRLPQQDFTYVEVEAGQGAYTWNDYNTNNIQELEEFELAQFTDQGSYIRVLLPNQVFIKTHQNRFSQTLTINPQQWFSTQDKLKSVWSHFYNQSSYLIDRKIKRDGNHFDLNPFSSNEEDQLGLQLNLKNILFFNRGKQRYTTSYTYLYNQSQNTLSFGFIENVLRSHQLLFTHKFAINWLLTFASNVDNKEHYSQNFSSRNFDINELQINPKLSYLLNDNTRFDMFYLYNNQDNKIGSFEQLKQHNIGFSFALTNVQKAAVTAEFNYFSNTFTGDSNTPVAYEMMNGLQPGNNFTWSILAQKKLTKFLDLNLNYFGRKSETSKTIHTGTVQLRAYF